MSTTMIKTKYVPNLTELFAVLCYGADNKDLVMHYWEPVSTDCGTACCLIGTYCLKTANSPLKVTPYGIRFTDDQVPPMLTSSYEVLSKHFGISQAMVRYLFGANGDWGRRKGWTEATQLNRYEALERLASFIAWEFPGRKNASIQQLSNLFLGIATGEGISVNVRVQVFIDVMLKWAIRPI